MDGRAEEAASTNFIGFDLTQSGFEPTFYRTRVDVQCIFNKQ